VRAKRYNSFLRRSNEKRYKRQSWSLVREGARIRQDRYCQIVN
jgi:hypothetical protein